MDSQNNKHKREFSKTLLIQESFLIWIITLSFILMAFISIWNGYLGSLPWLTAMVTCPWAAYGVSQAFYYNKSKAENTINGIKYDTMIKQYQQQQTQTVETIIAATSTTTSNTTSSSTEIDPWGPI